MDPSGDHWSTELGFSSTYHRLLRGNLGRLDSKTPYPDSSCFSHSLSESQSKEDKLRGAELQGREVVLSLSLQSVKLLIRRRVGNTPIKNREAEILNKRKRWSHIIQMKCKKAYQPFDASEYLGV